MDITPTNIATTDEPLSDFQAEVGQILAQANARLEHIASSPFAPPSSSPHSLSPQLRTPIPEPGTSRSQPSDDMAEPSEERKTCHGPIPVAESLWHGWLDACTICPVCYDSFAALSPLAQEMSLHDVFIPGPTVCDLYSPRQSNLYLRANDTGDLESFLKHCKERRKVWEETVGVILARREEVARRATIKGASAELNRLAEGFERIASLGDEDERKEEYRTEAGGMYSSWNAVVAERDEEEGQEEEEEEEEEEEDGLWEATVAELEDDEEVMLLQARWAEVE